MDPNHWFVLALFTVAGIGLAALLSIRRRRIGPARKAPWEYESEHYRDQAIESWRRQLAARKAIEDARDNEKEVE